MKLKTGKLPPRLLTTFLAGLEGHPDLFVGPAFGEDAAVLRLEKEYLVVATDPITFTTDDLGYYAVTVNANDVAATGAKPEYLIATVLLPEGCGETEAQEILQQIREACRRAKVVLMGGHTEITHDLQRPIVSALCLGRTRRPVLSGGSKPGDFILQINPVPVEAISILAREKAVEIRSSCGEEVCSRARDTLTDPGISIVEEALALAEIDGITSMHDVTEGGIIAALSEMAASAGCRFEIENSRILIHDLWDHVGGLFHIDPCRAIGSGTLLATVRPDSLQVSRDALVKLGSPVSLLGEVSEGKGLMIDGEEAVYPERDAITAIFEE